MSMWKSIHLCTYLLFVFEADITPVAFLANELPPFAPPCHDKNMLNGPDFLVFERNK